VFSKDYSSGSSTTKTTARQKEHEREYILAPSHPQNHAVPLGGGNYSGGRAVDSKSSVGNDEVSGYSRLGDTCEWFFLSQ
jgi:hypothetical protein